MLDELVEAGGLHVGHVNVADFAAGRFLDLPDIAFDPVVIVELRFIADRQTTVTCEPPSASGPC